MARLTQCCASISQAVASRLPQRFTPILTHSSLQKQQQQQQQQPCTLCCTRVPAGACTSPARRPWHTAVRSCVAAAAAAATDPSSSSSTTTTRTETTPARSSSSSSHGRSRAYPDEPRVGVGVVVFRRPVRATQLQESAEVLLIRRAKEPAKGQWCFPGGSLELGESIAACAAREVLEETGVHIRNTPGLACEGFSTQLQQPTPFAAVDSIVRDDKGQLAFHYVVVEVAAMAADSNAAPVAADDVDGVRWVQVSQLRQVEDLTANCAHLAEEAVQRFDLSQ